MTVEGDECCYRCGEPVKGSAGSQPDAAPAIYCDACYEMVTVCEGCDEWVDVDTLDEGLCPHCRDDRAGAAMGGDERAG